MWLLLLTACWLDPFVLPLTDTGSSTWVDTGLVIDTGLPGPQQSVAEHAATCAESLGPVPGFDCLDDGVPVRITVDTEDVDGPTGSCDAPSSLSGTCNPWARVGRIPGQHPDGSENPDVSFVFVCRTLSDSPPTVQGQYYDIVAMIGHDAATGDTCFFQANYAPDRRRSFPTPAEPVNQAIWEPPSQVAFQVCHECHAADPFIHTPWIDSAKLPGTDEPVVPLVAGPDTPYRVLGSDFASWQLTHFALEDNACTSCHRLAGGDCRTLEEAVGVVEGIAGWMPPEGSFSSADARQALDCCDAPFASECARTAL